MNPNKISPDDPRLTAYALDEMEPREHAEFARLLQDDPAARASMEEIRATAQALGAALEGEPATAAAPALDPAVILAGRDAPGRAVSPELDRARIFRFPQLYFVISGLAAACFAVFFFLYESRETVPDQLLAKKTMVMAGERNQGLSGTVADDAGNRPAPAMKAAPAPGPLPLVAAEYATGDRFFPTAEATASTFPLRVGRESYDAVRALLRRGIRPARETVHVAEMINAFTYTWPEPSGGDAFASVLEETAAPWAPGHRLVRVGLKGRDGPAQPLADDARVEVEFNPARVLAWRLVGFERDGGMAGVHGAGGETLRPGEAVTVLYELVPVATVPPDADRNLLRLALRYREPASGEARLFERVLPAGGTGFAEASADMKFATAVAAFGLRLRESVAQAPVALTEIEQWARADGASPERAEFLGLVQAAGRITK